MGQIYAQEVDGDMGGLVVNAKLEARQNLFGIFIVSVSSCLAIDNSIDEDYGDESRDVSQTRLQHQRPFNMENLQRLREKLEHVANLRKASGNSNSNSNRNTLRPGARIASNPMAKNEEKNSGQKTQDENQPKFNEMEFYDELQANLPYGIQNVRRDLTSRSTRNQMLLHKPKITFQSLCPSRRTIIPLETVSYEYRPNHYEEVTCFHSYAPSRDYVSDTNKICSEAGFTCIQLNRTVYLTRRVKGTECWESETRIVPSGCECMWPMHTFGDIITYH